MGQICKTCRNIHNVQIPQTASPSRQSKDGKIRYTEDSPELPSRPRVKSKASHGASQVLEKEKSIIGGENIELNGSNLQNNSGSLQIKHDIKIKQSNSPEKSKSEVQSEFEESKDEEGLERTQKYYKTNFGLGVEGEKSESITARTIESQMFEGLNKPKVDLIKIYTKGESNFLKNSMGLSLSRRIMNEEDINIFSDPFGVNQNVSVANVDDLQCRKSDHSQFENIFMISDLPP